MKRPLHLVLLIIIFAICLDATGSEIESPGFTPPDNSTCVTLRGDSVSNPTSVISSYYPTTNQRGPELVAQQWTFGGTSGEERGLLSFNLSFIPSKAYIAAANVSLYADTAASNGYAGEPTFGANNACNLLQVTSPWTANTVTWNNQPSVTTAGEVLLPQSTINTENYLNYDITTFVKYWQQNPSQNYGVMLKMITGNYYNIMDFCSSAYTDTGKRPQLQVCYIPCNAAASFTWQSLGGSLLQFTNTSTSNQVFSSTWTFYNASGAFATSNAVNPQITFFGQPPYSAQLIIKDTLNTICTDTLTLPVNFNPNTTCITLQKGATRATGASLSSSSPNQYQNFANGFDEFYAEQWTAAGNAIETRSLIRYDLSQIPAGSAVISAGLSLYADTLNSNGRAGSPTYGNANACNLENITSIWNPATVTWATQPSTTASGEVLLAQSTATDESYLNIDISAFAQAWVNNPLNNNGLMLQIISQSYYNSMIFCSSGHADSTKWPTLTICYIPPHTCQINASFVQQNFGNGQVLFTNTTTDNTAYSSNWVFYNSSGQFTTSSAVNPLVTFTGQPPYSAKLIITDSICSDTMAQAVSLTNCITFQSAGTKSTGAVISSLAPAQNNDFASGFSEFFAEQWTSGGTPLEIRGLLRYDLSQIPPGSVITSALLNLYTDSLNQNGYLGQPTYGTDNACYLQNITAPWNPATVTWANQPAATNSSQVLLPQSTGNNEDYLNIDVSTFVQNWVNGPGSNYGMMLKILTSAYYNSMIFCSPAYSDTIRCPQLNICYQLASPCYLGASFTQQNMGNNAIQFTNYSTSGNNTVINWTFYNSTGAFANSTAANPLITYYGSSPYSATIHVTDTLTGCSDTMNQVVNIASVGISTSVYTNNDLSIFPNPNNGNSFYIHWPSDFDAQTAGIRAYDMLGREISLASVERLQEYYRLSIGANGPAGVYTVIISNNSKQLCGKLIIVR